MTQRGSKTATGFRCKMPEKRWEIFYRYRQMAEVYKCDSYRTGF